MRDDTHTQVELLQCEPDCKYKKPYSWKKIKKLSASEEKYERLIYNLYAYNKKIFWPLLKLKLS
jgi:hypothetical protein